MRVKKIKFKNRNGVSLVSSLELPVDQVPKAYALFAHCFTCNRNLNAVRNISRALIKEGIAVFRFDFTGLGESEGDFADTNFSSNVEDLVAAAQFLAEEYEAPKILIGHSLGGAAVIFASHLIPSIQAVATVGAPSSPDHVQHLFEGNLVEIHSQNESKVTIGGRPFRIKKQFLDDISAQNMKYHLQHLDKPLLILHSPQDDTVGIKNASEIYEYARHPKSFISLHGADHLLSDKQDSLYVGQVIGSWLVRYVDLDTSAASLKTDQEVVVQIGMDRYTVDMKARQHTLIGDEPEELGGNDFGPTPYEFLLSSLGSCTAITLRMYADRKKWDVSDITVHLSHEKQEVDQDGTSEKMDVITRYVDIAGDVTEEQRSRLLAIAEKCPVHNTLTSRTVVRTYAHQREE